MKRTIRKGCFETNSSSMHSIVITKEDGNSTFFDYDSSYQCEDYLIYEDDIVFGRYPFQILNSIKDKARYAIASAYRDQDKIQEIINIVKKISGTELKVKKTHVEKYRNAETKEELYWYEVKWVQDPEDPDSEIAILKSEENVDPEKRTEIEYTEYREWQGGVDHQSSGLLDSFLKEEGITLEEFLTKKKYIVVIDGDEYCEFQNMKNAGIINMDNIEKQYPNDGSFDSYMWRTESITHD